MRFHTTQCYAHSPFLDKAVKPRLTWVSMKSLLNLDFLLQQGFQYRQINFSVQSSHTKIQLIVSIFIEPESDHWECFSLTHSLLFSKLDWCDPGMWRWQLKTCWGCYCYSCWWWEKCWLQFGEVKFGHYFAADAWFNLGQDSEARFGQDLSCVEMLIFGWGFEVGAWSRF